MNTLEIDATTDDSGGLHLRLPGVPAHRQVHLVVTWTDPMTDAEWAAWIDATAGSIDDPTFKRHPQCDCKKEDPAEPG